MGLEPCCCATFGISPSLTDTSTTLAKQYHPIDTMSAANDLPDTHTSDFENDAIPTDAEVFGNEASAGVSKVASIFEATEPEDDHSHVQVQASPRTVVVYLASITCL